MMKELDNTALSNTTDPRYLIPETVYEYNHPDVIYYTEYFLERAHKKNVFTPIDAALQNNRTLIFAEKIAGVWSEFSKFVPSFIAKAVSLTTDPEHQHHLIQIAYDELGSQNKNLIHSKLFLNALEKANIKPKETGIFLIKNLLSSLNDSLEKIKSHSGIIGMLLSFEIIAEQNIETVFQGLNVDSAREEILAESLFFKIHRTNEIEHIRHSIANFLRFSKSPEEIREAEEFFDIGINFWLTFWNKIAELCVNE